MDGWMARGACDFLIHTKPISKHLDTQGDTAFCLSTWRPPRGWTDGWMDGIEMPSPYARPLAGLCPAAGRNSNLRSPAAAAVAASPRLRLRTHQSHSHRLSTCITIPTNSCPESKTPRNVTAPPPRTAFAKYSTVITSTQEMKPPRS
jgi:hypothetical protein